MTPSLSADSGSCRLCRREKLGIVFLAALYLALGAITVARSAFMMNPKTDFQVYARAAWAVRAGENLYAVTDNNGWHYIYPPAFAIVMAPLADPYPFMPHGGYLPFWASAALWYLIGLGCVIYTVHALASVVLPDAVRGTRRWWYARLAPTLFCTSGIVLTISRGQVNTVLVALIAAGFVAAMRNRRLCSGAWLTSAAVLKIIPVMLVLFPILRRDWRSVAGGIITALLLLIALPAAIWGIPGAIDANRKTVELVLAPVLTKDADQSRHAELHGANSTHSQSVQAAVHTWMYPDPSTRPDSVAPIAKWAHLGSAAALLAITLIAARRRLTASPADQLLFLGCLCALMMLVTPISHLHYYAMVMPLVCGLWLRGMALRPDAAGGDRRTTVLLTAWAIVTAIPALPGPLFEWLRTAGFGTAATIGLWGYGLGLMGSDRRAQSLTEPLRIRIAA
jgi:alpha-1,2-mannosyltransferase